MGVDQTANRSEQYNTFTGKCHGRQTLVVRNEITKVVSIRSQENINDLYEKEVVAL
jgi:hypothetical protein